MHSITCIWFSAAPLLLQYILVHSLKVNREMLQSTTGPTSSLPYLYSFVAFESLLPTHPSPLPSLALRQLAQLYITVFYILSAIFVSGSSSGFSFSFRFLFPLSPSTENPRIGPSFPAPLAAAFLVPLPRAEERTRTGERRNNERHITGNEKAIGDEAPDSAQD